MILVLRVLADGKVVDRVAVGDDGRVSFENGAAQPVVEQVQRLTGVDGAELVQALDGFSNGYVVLEQARRA